MKSLLRRTARIWNLRRLKMTNSSKQISQLDVCSYVYDGMPDWLPAYLTTPVTVSLIFLSVINLLMSACTIFLNVLVMIAVKTSPRLKTNCNMLLASLAGTDLITGAIGQPLTVAKQIRRLGGSSVDSYSVCLLEGAGTITSVTASIQHLALLSIERYLAIMHPYKYSEIITKHRLVASAVTVWSVAALMTVLTYLFSLNNVFNSVFRVFLIVASISILIFCQIAVYREARSQMLKIASQQISKEARETFLKEKKALNTTRIVIGVVLLSFVPLFLFRLFMMPLLGSPAMKFVMEYAFRSLALCNSVCNPLIYCARNKEFRKAFKRLLCKQCHLQPNWNFKDNAKWPSKMMCKTMNAVHVDVWPHRKGCGKKRFHKRTISIVISINHPSPPLYHGGGMNLRLRRREYNIDFGGGDRHVC